MCMGGELGKDGVLDRGYINYSRNLKNEMNKSKLKELFIKSRYLKGKSLSKKERGQIADGYLAMRRLGVWK